MRPFWTRYLSPQDGRSPRGGRPAGGTPVKTLRYPSDEVEVPEEGPGPAGEPEVFTMRFPSDEPEVPEPQGTDR